MKKDHDDKTVQKARSNLESLIDIFFKQLTEIGSLTVIAVLIVCLFFFDKSLSLILAAGIFFATIISFAIKALFHKDRPKKQSSTNTIEKIDSSSFPSVHSVRVTIVTFWLILFFSDIFLQIFIGLIGVLVAYSRIYLRKHYLIDVIGGIVLGALINLGIYFLIQML